MEYKITCPHCKKTISNDSDIDFEGKEAGLISTFITCKCGERTTFWAILDQLRDQKNLPQELKIDFINLPWLEARIGLT